MTNAHWHGHHVGPLGSQDEASALKELVVKEDVADEQKQKVTHHSGRLVETRTH
jgi:hypothetical protein